MKGTVLQVHFESLHPYGEGTFVLLKLDRRVLGDTLPMPGDELRLEPEQTFRYLHGKQCPSCTVERLYTGEGGSLFCAQCGFMIPPMKPDRPGCAICGQGSLVETEPGLFDCQNQGCRARILEHGRPLFPEGAHGSSSEEAP